MPLTIKKWITTKLFGTVADDYNDNLDAIKAFVDGLEANASNYAPSSHNHTIAQVTGLQTALNGKEATLNADQKRKITISTSDPSGGTDGDIWIKV